MKLRVLACPGREQPTHFLTEAVKPQMQIQIQHVCTHMHTSKTCSFLYWNCTMISRGMCINTVAKRGFKFDLTLASKNCFLCGACVCKACMCTHFLTETETNIHWWEYCAGVSQGDNWWNMLRTLLRFVGWFAVVCFFFSVPAIWNYLHQLANITK